MTNYLNKTLLRDSKRWRIEQIDELDHGELDEQKSTQDMDSAGTDKKSDELGKFYCTNHLASQYVIKLLYFG